MNNIELPDENQLYSKIWGNKKGISNLRIY